MIGRDMVLTGDEAVSVARAVAIAAHKGQTDRAGEEYFWHPFAVAMKVSGDWVAECVAYLHDVLEDTSLTADDLRLMGFMECVIRPVEMLTHQRNLNYYDYIRRLADDPIARKVKLADLEHNTDPSRADSLPLGKAGKYEWAKAYLGQFEPQIDFD